MSWFNRITPKVTETATQVADKLASKKPQRLPYRFSESSGSGWININANFHPARTNTVEEYISSMNACIQAEKSAHENYVQRAIKTAIECAKDIGVDVQKLAKEKFDGDIIAAASSLGDRKYYQPNGDETIIHFANLQKNVEKDKLAHDLNISEMKAFIEQMPSIPPRYLSLAQDTVDLAQSRAGELITHKMFPSVDLNSIVTRSDTKENATILSYTLSTIKDLIDKAPQTLDLTEKVMSHSGPDNARYFLWKVFNDPRSVASLENVKATEKLVPQVADEILQGMPSWNLGPTCKENKFFEAIMDLCDKSKTSLEDLDLFGKVVEMKEKFLSRQAKIDFNTLKQGDRALIEENMEVLPQVLENVNAQNINGFNISDFVTKNVNMR